MLDIKLIRENPEKINELLKRRNPELSIDNVLEIDNERRKVQFQTDELRAKRKTMSQAIGELKKAGKNTDENGKSTDEMQKEVKDLAEEIKVLEEKQGELDIKQKEFLLCTPNTPDENIAIGTDDSFNVVKKTVGEPTRKPFELKPHWDLGVNLGLLDFERGVKLAHTRFTLYRGKGAALERAIINFFLEVHTKEHGYEEIMPPVLVNSAAMTGTGQLPKFREDMFKCENEDLFLIPTAEVPVTNIYQNEILNEDELPKYMTAYTPCFRREAGSAGKDTRGLIRQHQFNKVELVKLTTPETSEEEHEKLTRNAERVLELLNLPFRRMELCTGDIGFSAKKCYDLEVWMPSYDNYKEISSCSNFGDFQARRANIKYRNKTTGKVEFVHTLNGSGIAVGRTFAAILENFQTEDGHVVIPEVLRKYTGFDII